MKSFASKANKVGVYAYEGGPNDRDLQPIGIQVPFNTPAEMIARFLLKWWQLNDLGKKSVETSSTQTAEKDEQEALEGLGKAANANDEKSCVCVDDAMVDEMLELIDWDRVSTKFLKILVSPSGLLSDKRLLELYERRLMSNSLAERSAPYVFKMAYEGPVSYPRRAVSLGRIALGRNDELLAVTDTQNGQVCMFETETGQLLHTSEANPDSPEGHAICRGLAFRESDLYLSVHNPDHKQILIFDSALQYKGSFGDWGEGAGEMRDPDGLAFTNEGMLLVGDVGNSRIQVLRHDGSSVHQFPVQQNSDAIARGVLPCGGQLTLSDLDIAVGRAGIVVAAGGFYQSSSFDMLQVYSHDGDLIWYTQLRDVHQPDIAPLRGVAMGAGGEIVTLAKPELQHEVYTSGVKIISFEGLLIREIMICDPQLSYFKCAVSVAVARDGSMFVADLGLQYVLRLV